jgi:hypothetical protein
MEQFADLASLLFMPFAVEPLHAQPAAVQHNKCFLVTQFEHWKAPDEKTMDFSVPPDRRYRLDLSGKCPALLWLTSHLVTVFRGANTVWLRRILFAHHQCAVE